MTDPRAICERMIDMASCLETFGGWPRILAWNLGIAALLNETAEIAYQQGLYDGIAPEAGYEDTYDCASPVAGREHDFDPAHGKQRCRYDHDGDGNCHVHPGGCQ